MHVDALGIITNERVEQWVIAYINEDYSFWFCFDTNFVKAYLPPCKDIYSVGISPYYVECLAVEWMDQRWQEYETELWKGEENFSLWDKVKKLLRHLDQKFQCQPSRIFNRFLKYIRIFFQYLTIDNILSNRWNEQNFFKIFNIPQF